MSTAVGAQKRQSRRGLIEAYRLLLRRCERVSTVTTVSKLVDSLATTFSGDLMDPLTDFERRVASSWKHEAKRNIVSFDQNRSCHPTFGEKWVFGIMCSSSSLLARQNGRNL